MIYALWHGGAGYSAPDSDDLEEFATPADASYALRERRIGWGTHVFQYAGRDDERSETPCVDETSEMWVFLSDPRESSDGDWYPDRIIKFGPRGGVRVERA